MLEHLYSALDSTYGIRLSSDSPEALRQKLYIERQAANDPQLKVLSFVLSPLDPRELWIVKRKEPENGEA